MSNIVNINRKPKGQRTTQELIDFADKEINPHLFQIDLAMHLFGYNVQHNPKLSPEEKSQILIQFSKKLQRCLNEFEKDHG